MLYIQNKEKILILLYFCTRVLQGRYVTIFSQDNILSNTFVTILSQATTTASDNSGIFIFERISFIFAHQMRNSLSYMNF